MTPDKEFTFADVKQDYRGLHAKEPMEETRRLWAVHSPPN